MLGGGRDACVGRCRSESRVSRQLAKVCWAAYTFSGVMVRRMPTALQAFMIGMARSDDIDRVLTRRSSYVVQGPRLKQGFAADRDAIARDLGALRGDRVHAERKSTKSAFKGRSEAS